MKRHEETISMKREKIDIIYYIVLGILFLICIGIHFYKITEIPFGIHVDELGMGYDAWSLSHYGVDRYLIPYPAYLNNFGGGQSALYAYLCALILKFCDLSTFSIRLPGILIFLVFVLFGVKTIQLTKENCRVRTFLFLFFVTVLPVYIMLFRMGLDCNLMLPVAGIFFYFLLRAVSTLKNSDFVLAGIFAGITLYTYAISYIVMIGFLIAIIPYMFFTKKMKPIQLLYFGIPLGIIALPLILVQVVNLLNLDEMRLGFFTITKLFRYRNEDIGLQFFNWESVKSCLKSIFMYDSYRWDSLTEFGTIYYLSIPFVLIGVIKSVYVIIKGLKNREFYQETIYVVWLILLCICGSMMEAFTYRLNGVYLSILYFLVEGVITIFIIIKNKKIAYLILGTVVMVYAFLFGSFLQFYFGGEYESKYKPLSYFDYPLEEVIDYLENDDIFREKTTYIGHLSQTYIYYLSAKMITPMEYNEVNILDKEDSLSRSQWTQSYHNYYFNLPERIDYNGIYVLNSVAEVQEGYGEKLAQAGFEKEEIGNYSVYTFNIEDFEDVEDNFQIQWNAGVDENNTILVQSATQLIEGKEYVVLVGWAYNIEDVHAWDYVCLMDEDGNYYTADIVERADVVEETGQEQLQQSGLLFVIPKEAFDGRKNLLVIGIESENGKYMKSQINVAMQ